MGLNIFLDIIEKVLNLFKNLLVRIYNSSVLFKLFLFLISMYFIDREKIHIHTLLMNLGSNKLGSARNGDVSYFLFFE